MKSASHDNALKELTAAAIEQDNYDLNTINLIAPASPTPLKYFHATTLRHNAIAEGLLENRPYAGVAGFNKIEKITADLACKLFDADHANVQPHSVSQANQAVYQGLLENGDSVLAMKFNAGGHLTHGLKINFSGRFYNFFFYGVDGTGYIDYEAVEELAKQHKPKMIVCGASSYPRSIDFEKLATIAKKVNAYLVADLSHPAGLIIGGHFPQPFPHCNVVTLTPDKTMLGPHGGIILCKKEHKEKIDKAVHPGVQSSIPLRRIFETASCLVECSTPWFQDYTDRLMNNMKRFEEEFNKHADLVVTGGTDSNLMVLNTRKVFGLTGKEAEGMLENLDILTNRQVVPGEKLSPYVASGIRLGATWVTARGYSEEEISLIASLITKNLKSPGSESLRRKTKKDVATLLNKKRTNDVWLDEAIR